MNKRKSILRMLIAICIISIVTEGCQKRAICTTSVNGASASVRLYQGDFETPSDYDKVVAGLEAQGYTCTEKEASTLIK